MNRRLAISMMIASALLTPSTAMADSASGGISIHHPSARPTLPNRPGAVYAGIHNDAAHEDRLIGASAPGVGRIELHESVTENDVTSMRPIDGVSVPAGGVAHLEPGGAHLMLFDIAAPLKEGDQLPVTLRFQEAGEIEVMVQISRKGHKHGGHHNHSQGEHKHHSHDSN